MMLSNYLLKSLSDKITIWIKEERSIYICRGIHGFIPESLNETTVGLKKMYNMRIVSKVLFRAKWLHSGESTSDRSEKLLQRSGAEGVKYVWFWWKGVHEIKHLPYKIFSASQKELMSPWSDLDARIGIMKSAPENIKLSKDLSHQFFWSTEYLILLPELPLGHIKDQQQKQHRLNPHRGRWQMPLANSILFLIQQQKKEKIICVKIFQTIQVSTF